MTLSERGGPLVEVRDLTVTVEDSGGPTTVVDEVSFTIEPGQIIGIVGESGAGKSMTALAMTRMLPAAASITSGQVRFEGGDLARADAGTLRRIRGGQIGMVFQDPLSSLNPVMTVGAQIDEALRLHGSSRRDARRRTLELLGLVGIRDPSSAVHDYPHEFSGGMRQRVMIAIAVANNPRLLIADEPTTGLDVTIQAEVLALLARLRDELGAAVMLITHDIGVVEEICDRLTVLYGGRVAESGPLATVLAGLRHPYTWQLIRSVPRLDGPSYARLPAIPGAPPDMSTDLPGCLFAPRCSFAQPRCAERPPVLAPGPGAAPEHVAACWEINDAGRTLALEQPAEAAGEIPAAVHRISPADGDPVVELQATVIDYHAGRRRGHRPVGPPAVDGVDLSVHRGQVLGLIGESGSGKSSIARAIVGLVAPTAGEVTVDGGRWAQASPEQRLRMRRSVQLVFQDPLSSMNPRWRVRQIVSEPLRMSPETGGRTAAELLELVGLDERLLDRYPDELSGGQRQRVGIARALALRPKVIVADEPVSALDVSVQAQVINVLCDLRDQFDVGLVFVAHDLAVARHVSDEVAVMFLGRIVERGPAEDVLRRPRHPYTRQLVGSVPGSGARPRPVPTPDMPSDLRVGCRFRDRCPVGPLVRPERTICQEVDPRLIVRAGHEVACHFAADADVTGCDPAPAIDARIRSEAQ